LGALSQVLLFPDADRERAGNRLLDYADEVSPRKRGNPLLEERIRSHVRDNSLPAQLGEIGRQGRTVRDNIGPWAKSLPGRVGNFVVDEGKRLGGTIGGIIDNEIDPMSDEAIQAVFETTGLLALQAPLTGAKGAAGVFGGRLAKTADLDALSRAERMAASGADRRAIWDETGWFKGRDGQWRFEIDDGGATSDLREALIDRAENARFSERAVDPRADTMPLAGVVGHKDLYDAYPDLADIDTRFIPDDWLDGASGAYGRKADAVILNEKLAKNTDQGREMALHEIQHAIQAREGFAAGGKPSLFPDITSQQDEVIGLATRYQEQGLSFREALERAKSDLDPHQQYRSLAGEVEARNVQTRRDFSPEQRRAQAPWETQDVPDDLQIVRMGGDGPQMSVGNPLLDAPQGGNALLAPETPRIRAYHGSPHDFDRFDLSKIGTGEGAQAYGHGLYFAENEGIARGYRDGLRIGVDYQGGGYPGGDSNRAAKFVADRAIGDSPDFSAIIPETAKELRGKAAYYRAYPDRAPTANAEAFATTYDDFARQVELLDPSDFRFDRGRLYEVDINADPSRFLDWDAPLSGQSQSVRDALGPMGFKVEDVNATELVPKAEFDKMYSDRFGTAKSYELSPEQMAEANAMRLRPAGQMRNDPTGQRIIEDMSGGDAGFSDGITQRFRDSGIPGIKYLDAGSRGAGDGSRNFVVFDDSLITILRKYGVASLAALPPAVLATMGLDAEQAADMDANRAY
jgi:hypothetical protein